MCIDASERHESVIQIAMLLAEKSGYSTDAWRLFEAQAKDTLTRMSKPVAPNLQPDLADVEAREPSRSPLLS
jgi:hypothetical protein